MKIVVVGGGPSGLYFSLLMKKANPAHDILVLERNRPDDTFGFGVVFSDETLGNFMGNDRETYERITREFAYWDEIEVRFKGRSIVSGGHGFAGLSRLTLLQILQDRCAELGVKIKFQTEVTDLAPYADADLILLADGVNSFFRDKYKEHFQPEFDWRLNKFCWLGTTKFLPAFLFSFRESEYGVFMIAAYSYDDSHSTVVLECSEETWKRAGLDKANEDDTVKLCERIFAEDLDGQPALKNRSLWRNFPMVRNRRWTYRNMVLMGDALHTAHYSIGSGTKLAMEDAIALYESCIAHPGDVQKALARFEEVRRTEVEKTQYAADYSLVWFEKVQRYWDMDPMQFAFSLISRSKQITYENLKLRDEGFVKKVDRWWAGKVNAEQGTSLPVDDPPPPIFTPFRLGGLVLENRIVCSPMDQYSAEDGMPNDWHLVHLGSRAIGGAGLIGTEMTCVSREGRISPGCTGLYKPEHVPAWTRIVDFVHANSRAKIMLQIGHSGRKGSTGLGWAGMDEPLPDAAANWPVYSASAIAWEPANQVPVAVDRAKMDEIRDDFVRTATWAAECGFDVLELHMAHGYLLASFISPLTNARSDAYGGSLDNRLRYPLEILAAVRAAWPAERPISVRISATDWEDGGIGGDEAVEIAKRLHAGGADLIDVSAGQTTPNARPVYGRMFQTPFADQIRQEARVPTVAVGNITTADQANTIVASGRADLVAVARPHLADPYFTLHAAVHYGYEGQYWPPQYWTGRDQAMRLAEREREDERQKRLAAQPAKPQLRPRRAAE